MPVQVDSFPVPHPHLFTAKKNNLPVFLPKFSLYGQDHLNNPPLRILSAKSPKGEGRAGLNFLKFPNPMHPIQLQLFSAAIEEALVRRPKFCNQLFRQRQIKSIISFGLTKFASQFECAQT